MKALLATVFVLGLSATAFTFADAVKGDEISFSALQESIQGPVKTLAGSVRIETSDVIVRADKATFNVNTLEIQPEGRVKITLKR